MSTAPVVKIAGTGAAAATWTTASYTPAANSREVAYVSAFKSTAGVALPTISDSAGNTWTWLADKEISTAANPNIRGAWFISDDVGGSPAARTVTVASTGAASMAVMVGDVLSADTDGTIVQSASGEDLANGDPSCTFGSTPGASNICLAGASFGGGNTATARPTGFSNLANFNHSTARANSASYDVASASQGPLQYTSLNVRSIILAIELAPASGGSVNGSVNATVDPVTQSAAGTVTISGSFAQTIAAVTQSTTGTLTIQGGLSQTIGPVTQTTTGALPINGSFGQTIDPVTLSANGTQGSPVNATFSQTIGPVTQSTTGAVVIQGTFGQTISPVTLDATGSSVGPVNATFDGVISEVTLTATGELPSEFRVTSTGTGYAYKTLSKLRQEEREKLAKAQKQASKAVAAVIHAPGILSGDLTGIVHSAVAETPQYSWLTPEMINLIVARIEAQFRRAFIQKQQEDEADEEDAFILAA